MTTLAEFYNLISIEMKRGSTLDSLIPGKVAMALRWMERRHIFLHTEKFNSLLLSAASSNPRTIAQPAGFRGMYFWNIVSTAADNTSLIYQRINHVDPTDVAKSLTGLPSAYWQDGKDFFWLDNTPDQDYNTEISYNAYTVLPTDTSQSPQVIQDFPDVILNQTMILLAPNMRSIEVAGLYKPNRDEAMQSAVDADVEERQSYRSEAMQYGWQYKESVNKSLLAQPSN